MRRPKARLTLVTTICYIAYRPETRLTLELPPSAIYYRKSRYHKVTLPLSVAAALAMRTCAGPKHGIYLSRYRIPYARPYPTVCGYSARTHERAHAQGAAYTEVTTIY